MQRAEDTLSGGEPDDRSPGTTRVLPERPEPPEAPTGDLLYRHRPALARDLRELWRSRELVRTLAERDFRVRYKQAFLGFAWAVITPVAFTVVFTVVFTRFARVDHGDVPYPLFAYLGLLPWSFFATSLNTGGMSLVTNVPLLNKVACPREVFPLATTVVAGVDMALSCAVLGVLFLIYGTTPALTWLWVPVLLAVQVAFTLGVVLTASALIVYLRDVRYALPVLLQLGLFATPVAWSLSALPTWSQYVYVCVNPLAGVIDGYRRALLEASAPTLSLLVPAALCALLYLLVGYRVFKRLETGFADVA